MPRPCESCRHPKAEIINRKLKQGVTLGDISRWLESEGHEFYLSTAALGRHAKHVELPRELVRGARPFVGDPLDLIIDKGTERIAKGEAAITPDQVIRAIGVKDQRANRDADRDFMRIAFMALTGQTLPDAIEGEVRWVDEEAEAEVTALLTEGGNSGVSGPR